ncbi:aluminum-activated malate transporter 2 [Eucalyptus grandis]|uniref:aluminum-activated malate transporter 2 n=1 Tax=Eucalyptus grandis TaxID=71139 RepID=UPI00192E9F67|nr:aluminum-activated malate transporter 2 [Eucalyptus grandis]
MVKAAELAKKKMKLGKDDKRRITHSLKVGFALSLVSLIYYCQPLYNSFGVSAMWAVMTVVVVFELHVGATLSKGLNRGLATFFAGALGVGAHHLASLSGKTGEPIMLGFFVFLQATSSTFIRFFPRVKAKYDYGMLIFILTFALVSVSGFREDEILVFAHKRLSTIVIGGSACLIISVIVCPVWAGEDLHLLIALNMEKLANFLEGFGNGYLRESEDSDSNKNKSLLQGYKSVLGTKSNEESLANFASWEPRHGWFGFRHPWKQYLKIGALIRQCAYRIETLDSYLTTKFHAPPQVQTRLEELCLEMSREAARALKQLASSHKTMTVPSSATPYLEKSRTAATALKSLLKTTSWKDENDHLTVIHAATVTSLLLDVIDCTDKIAESVNELASLARFKTAEKAEKHVKCGEVVLTESARGNRLARKWDSSGETGSSAGDVDTQALCI